MNDRKAHTGASGIHPPRLVRLLIAGGCILLGAFRFSALDWTAPTSWIAVTGMVALSVWAVIPRKSMNEHPLRRGLIWRWIAAADPAFRSSYARTGFIMMLAAAVFAPLFIPASPDAQGDLMHSRLLAPLATGNLQQSVFSEPVEFFFLLGSDQIGRDVFSRLFIGLGTSLWIAIVATACALFVGIVIGALSVRNPEGRVFTWITDVFLSIPSIFLVIALAFFFGHSLAGLVLVLISSGWMRTARIIRGETMHLREREFVQAAMLLGQPWHRIMLRHILPNCAPVVATSAVLMFSEMLLAEAALGFLGFGVQPPLPSLGNMLGDGVAHLQHGWWLAGIPGITLTMLLLFLHRISETLEAAFRS